MVNFFCVYYMRIFASETTRISQKKEQQQPQWTELQCEGAATSTDSCNVIWPSTSKPYKILCHTWSKQSPCVMAPQVVPCNVGLVNTPIIDRPRQHMARLVRYAMDKVCKFTPLRSSLHCGPTPLDLHSSLNGSLCLIDVSAWERTPGPILCTTYNSSRAMFKRQTVRD